MTQSVSSTDKLVAALIEAKAPDYMVHWARQDRYHDFKSPSATPLVDLVMDAHQAHLPSIVRMAQEGAFDATSAEADAWAETTEGRELTKLFEG